LKHDLTFSRSTDYGRSTWGRLLLRKENPDGINSQSRLQKQINSDSVIER